MAQFIEVRNAETDELIGVRTALKDAKLLGASECGMSGFTLIIMDINVNSESIMLLLSGGGYSNRTEIREYSVNMYGTAKEVK